MKIVIDIPDKEFQACVRRDANMTGGMADNYIANGTVLPKGHGDLIDRNVAYDVLDNANLSLNCSNLLKYIPTVIPADN